MILDLCFIVNLFNVIIISIVNSCLLYLLYIRMKLNRCTGFSASTPKHNHNHNHINELNNYYYSYIL